MAIQVETKMGRRKAWHRRGVAPHALALVAGTSRVSLRELSERSGIDARGLCRIFNGRVAPGADTIAKIVNAMSCDVVTLLNVLAKERDRRKQLDVGGPPLGKREPPRRTKGKG